MDSILSNQQSTEPQGVVLKPNNGKKVGFLEIILAGIIIILILGILNYFNILPISDLYQKKSSNIPPNTPISTQQTNLPTPASKPTFQYDTKKAETLLTQYIKDNIKPEFLPAQIEVKHKLVGTGKQEGTEYTFGANWTINQDFFQSNFHYAINTNSPDDIEFLIRVEDAKNITLDPPLAINLTSKYLKNVPSDIDFDCKTVNTPPMTSCENFLMKPEGKKGYGIMFSKQNNMALLFSCFVPTETTKYGKATSCLSL